MFSICGCFGEINNDDDDNTQANVLAIVVHLFKLSNFNYFLFNSK